MTCGSRPFGAAILRACLFPAESHGGQGQGSANLPQLWNLFPHNHRAIAVDAAFVILLGAIDQHQGY